MNNKCRILVTGASGFVGNAVVKRLVESESVDCTGAIRTQNGCNKPLENQVVVAELERLTDWSSALQNQHIVIHTAARAHIMKDEVPDPLAEYRKVNVDGTLNLARQAAESGVKRFIFISSIKVNGEQTFPHPDPLPGGEGKVTCFTEQDAPAPEDAYGISKLEAEQGLQKLAAETGMEVVIIRPPLVYGPGVKGNFATLLRLVEKGLPLPLGAVHNKRSLVALDNLVDLIVTCLDHPAAANQIFLAGDGEDLSTTELLRCIAKAMDKPARLIPIPVGMLMFGATLLGKKAVAKRVLGSLQVDISKARDVLGWEPVVGVEAALEKAVNRE